MSDQPLIFLHPLKRKELFEQGTTLFNDEKFFEAHEAWEELWKLEKNEEKLFIQGMIQAAGHFVHLQKQNYSGAKSLAELAYTKLQSKTKNYRTIDIEPLFSALDYNLQILNQPTIQHLQWDLFLVPKLLD